MLRTLPREHENYWTAGLRDIGDDVIRIERFERRRCISRFAADDRPPVLKFCASQGQRVRRVRNRRVSGGFQMGRQSLGGFFQCPFCFGGNEQQMCAGGGR